MFRRPRGELLQTLGSQGCVVSYVSAMPCVRRIRARKKVEEPYVAEKAAVVRRRKASMGSMAIPFVGGLSGPPLFASLESVIINSVSLRQRRNAARDSRHDHRVFFCFTQEEFFDVR